MPHYPIDADTKRIIFGFLERARELGMGDVSFHYYAPDVDFYLEEYKEYWELVVKSGKCTDVYRVSENELGFRYSEQD
jgi:hypothetical protein